MKLSKGGQVPPAIFEWTGDSREKCRRCQLRSGLKLHLYISQPPCEYLTPFHIVVIHLRAAVIRLFVHAQPILLPTCSRNRKVIKNLSTIEMYDVHINE